MVGVSHLSKMLEGTSTIASASKGKVDGLSPQHSMRSTEDMESHFRRLADATDSRLFALPSCTLLFYSYQPSADLAEVDTYFVTEFHDSIVVSISGVGMFTGF